nr:NUDIX domain-containing protein [Burkholderia sp. WSM2230]
MKHRATVLCLRANRILLVARANGRWALPGGRCKAGEPISAAAVRELVEETQLSDLALHYIFEFRGARTRHYVFAARIPDNVEPVPGHEIRRCRWIRAKDIHSAWVSVSTRGIVQVLFEERGPLGSARQESLHRVFFERA